jgi:hypothetical protein
MFGFGFGFGFGGTTIGRAEHGGNGLGQQHGSGALTDAEFTAAKATRFSGHQRRDPTGRSGIPVAGI